MRLENYSGRLSILASQDGHIWQTISTDIDISGFHHNNVGGFLALRTGLCGTGSDKARFHNFRHKVLSGNSGL